MPLAPALFIADATALDFLNSVATPVDVPVEWLGDGAGLLSWLQQAQLVSAPELKRVRSQFSAAELNEVADRARDLREWFRGFVHRHQGRPLTRDDAKKLEPLNRLLERDESFSQIAPATGQDNHHSQDGQDGQHSRYGNALELRLTRRWRSPAALLCPIAETLARFICSEDFTCVKACEGPTCTLHFADHTRGRARRWCSMAICGNRAKQAAHRDRLKAQR